MKHWLSMLEMQSAELQRLVARAREIKGGGAVTALRGKVMTALYFNPSLRTRTSFEAGMFRYGGHCISLSPGNDTWGFELAPGAVMDGNKAEHISEAVRVVSRYSNCLGVRSFAGLKDAAEDRRDEMLHAIARFATVPVVNLESAMEHPCQALADMTTLAEKLQAPHGKNFVLRWAPHIKPLPLAVPHSAVLAAALSGMNVTVCHPPGYDLSRDVSDRAAAICKEAGMQYRVVNVLAEDGGQPQWESEAHALYVKSWGAPALYGDEAKQREQFKAYADWRVGTQNLSPGGILMHCLPVRRNVVIDDAALDSRQSVIIDQAENRLWAQVALLEALLGNA